MATLSNESACGASFNKFSMLQELSGIDADQSLEVLESIDRDVSEDEAANAQPNENLRRAETSKSDLHLALPDNKEISSLKIEELKAKLDKCSDFATPLYRKSEARKQLKPTQRFQKSKVLPTAKITLEWMI